MYSCFASILREIRLYVQNCETTFSVNTKYNFDLSYFFIKLVVRKTEDDRDENYFIIE